MNLDFYVDFWKRGFDFKGRSSRKEFWLTYLVNLGITFLLSLLIVIPYLSVLSSFWGFALLIPTLAISVRRLHDSNHSCIPIVIIYAIQSITIVYFIIVVIMALILTVSGAIAEYDYNLYNFLWFTLPLVILLICSAIHIVYMCLPPTRGINKYGPMRDAVTMNYQEQYQQQQQYYQQQNTNYQNINTQTESMNQNQNNPYFQSYEKTYGNTSNINSNTDVPNNEL